MSNGQNQEHERVTIRRSPTGVPGLDETLGGGLPEYSFDIIAGGPGHGPLCPQSVVPVRNKTAPRRCRPNRKKGPHE
jgi:circadian clock protein KaiC